MTARLSVPFLIASREAPGGRAKSQRGRVAGELGLCLRREGRGGKQATPPGWRVNIWSAVSRCINTQPVCSAVCAEAGRGGLAPGQARSLFKPSNSQLPPPTRHWHPGSQRRAQGTQPIGMHAHIPAPCVRGHYYTLGADWSSHV